MLELVDEELVEHERWAEAGRQVGGAASEGRADFIAAEVGGGLGEGFETAFETGLVTTVGLRVVEKAIPGIGQVVGGVFAAHALVTGWDRNAAAVGHMGEGRSGYEEAANDIEGVCAILDVASNLVNVLAGVAGVVAVAAVAAAFLTLGALAPLAVAAGDLALAFGAAGMTLGMVKMALQPLVLLFRSLHAFTSEADPREIEAQGRILEEGGKEMGGALGGLAGAAVGGGRAHGPPEPQETPPRPANLPSPPAQPAAHGPPHVLGQPGPGQPPPALALRPTQ